MKRSTAPSSRPRVPRGPAPCCHVSPRSGSSGRAPEDLVDPPAPAPADQSPPCRSRRLTLTGGWHRRGGVGPKRARAPSPSPKPCPRCPGHSSWPRRSVGGHRHALENRRQCPHQLIMSAAPGVPTSRRGRLALESASSAITSPPGSGVRVRRRGAVCRVLIPGASRPCRSVRSRRARPIGPGRPGRPSCPCPSSSPP